MVLGYDASFESKKEAKRHMRGKWAYPRDEEV
jgi:hypothetical protein